MSSGNQQKTLIWGKSVLELVAICAAHARRHPGSVACWVTANFGRSRCPQLHPAKTDPPVRLPLKLCRSHTVGGGVSPPVTTANVWLRAGPGGRRGPRPPAARGDAPGPGSLPGGESASGAFGFGWLFPDANPEPEPLHLLLLLEGKLELGH